MSQARTRDCHGLSEMIQSMTGYAAASVDSPRGRLSLELRSVNARFLDLQFRVAEELRALEPMLRELIVARVSRGKLDCRLFLNESGGSGRPQQLNTEAIARLKTLGEEARKAFPEAAALRVADILRWPGVTFEPPPDEQPTRETARKLCSAALDELLAARAREGAKLAAVGEGRIALMHRHIQAGAPLVPALLPADNAAIGQPPRDDTTAT